MIKKIKIERAKTSDLISDLVSEIYKKDVLDQLRYQVDGKEKEIDELFRQIKGNNQY